MFAVITGNDRGRREDKADLIEGDGSRKNRNGSKGNRGDKENRGASPSKEDKDGGEVQAPAEKWRKVAIVYLPHLGHGDSSTTEDLATRISTRLAGTHD